MTQPVDVARTRIDEASHLIRGLSGLAESVASVARRAITCIESGHTIFFIGNGGSAAEAEHLAAELSGRFEKERRSLPAIALVSNSAAVTAIANDFAFKEVFSRQIEGLARPDDMLIALSTSGVSANIVSALQAARRMKVQTCALTGASGGDLLELADVCIRVPSESVPRIQEAHQLLGHIICELVEAAFVD